MSFACRGAQRQGSTWPLGDPPLDPINWITARQCVDPAVFSRQEGEYGKELEVKDH